MAAYQSFHVNCGGEDVTIRNEYGKIVYEGDKDIEGAAAKNYISKTNWGFSSTGEFMHDDVRLTRYTLESSRSMNYSELYTTARITPISLTYYGFCLKNGIYSVKLHFAELQFTDDVANNRVARRIFDIYIQVTNYTIKRIGSSMQKSHNQNILFQGELVRQDFHIQEEINGTDKEVIKLFNATVEENFLEIRLYWAGKGTTCIPARGNYGPLISAISVCHSKFNIKFRSFLL